MGLMDIVQILNQVKSPFSDELIQKLIEKYKNINNYDVYNNDTKKGAITLIAPIIPIYIYS